MTDPTRAHLIALLHRARTVLMHPSGLMDGLLDKRGLIADIDEALPASYLTRKPAKDTCYCGEVATDGRHCNEHTDMEVGDG